MRYRLNGAVETEFVADAEGAACFSITLYDRTQVSFQKLDCQRADALAKLDRSRAKNRASTSKCYKSAIVAFEASWVSAD